MEHAVNDLNSEENQKIVAKGFGPNKQDKEANEGLKPRWEGYLAAWQDPEEDSDELKGLLAIASKLDESQLLFRPQSEVLVHFGANKLVAEKVKEVTEDKEEADSDIEELGVQPLNAQGEVQKDAQPIVDPRFWRLMRRGLVKNSASN